MAKLERRADSDDEFRQADVVPFGATDDTVLTVVSFRRQFYQKDNAR